MDDKRRRAWLTQATGVHTSRAIAEKIGAVTHSTVTHTTVLRWMKTGIPPDVVFTLAIHSNMDICETIVSMGWATRDELYRANIDGLMSQLPDNRLTGELHRRAVERGDDDLGRSDTLVRRSFRLSAK
ncbi:hypothetical protein [Agromyces cerinus]|uniref:Uncharacterized protein n=1 Tax=Agromyces cerinus subsp. cerinus TaxID=232089 RepID=A0A1N6DNS9_9MICO|nr:hypothetical protein [Agromyces cerinus]SIN72452.1 hypothetical protein SAMN05443544_0535 [Agromyces cerinus subsp. cerinus]